MTPIARRLVALSVALLLAGCAGQAWDQVREQDSAAAYRRFLSEHPTSSHAAEAKERLAVLQVERDPTPEALDRFRSEFPASTATPELAHRVETRLFETARAEATSASYDRFVAKFPDGELASRARGNAEYLRAGGFAGRPDALQRFIDQHATSDYAPEAQRALTALQARSGARLGSVGLQIEIAAGVGDADRLRNAFRERAREIYANAGVALVDGAAGATLTISHDERMETAQDQGGRLSKSGIVAETTVTLQRTGDAEPIWVEQFAATVRDGDLKKGGSALLARSAAGYWDRFFVPVATWPTQTTRRSAWSAGGGLAGVAVDVARAIALSPDGSFRELDLSDPTAPRVIAQYKRPAGVARFSGVRRFGTRVVLFGEEGIEVVVRQGSVYRRALALDRGSVGAVAGVDEANGQLFAAGSRGLLRVSLESGTAERVFERALRGVARSGDTLFVLDDAWLHAGSASDPRPDGFATVAELGRGMEPRSLHLEGGLAVVVGARTLACFDVSGGAAVRPLARTRPGVLGDVRDVELLGGAVFLLGDRGLQIFDPVRGRIVDAVDVKGRSAIGGAGRQVVAIGGDRLEVVDATPWIAAGAPASPAR